MIKSKGLNFLLKIIIGIFFLSEGLFGLISLTQFSLSLNDFLLLFKTVAGALLIVTSFTPLHRLKVITLFLSLMLALCWFYDSALLFSLPILNSVDFLLWLRENSQRLIVFIAILLVR